jgi:hypothetical protein
MLMHITNACRATIYADVCDDPDGSCSCVATARLFVRGERFVVRARDKNTFCLRDLGWVTLPNDCFALHRFSKVFIAIWKAAPSVTAVVDQLEALGYRRWDAGRVRRYANRLMAKGARLKPPRVALAN